MSGHLPPMHAPVSSLPPPPPPLYPPTAAYEHPPSVGRATLSPQTTPGAGQRSSHHIDSRSAEGRSYPGHARIPPMAEGIPRYVGEYDIESPALEMLHVGHQADQMIPGLSAGPHELPGHLQGHKRAYRQRRKDPSCDACRERKVKCDATDASSCSECSSRNVKCQFTKETNRRMSSIKQVQDLEKQLMVAKQQVSHYQSLVRSSSMTVEEEESSPGGPGPTKRRKLSHHSSLSIQATLLQHSRGLVMAPTLREESGRRCKSLERVPPFPSREVTERLVRNYQLSVQVKLPFQDWSKLLQLIDHIYREGRLEEVSVDTVALFFGSLACGALVESVDEALPYFEHMRALIDFWADTPSLNMFRDFILATIFLTELNQRRLAYSFVGCAVRIAQDMGLHHHSIAFSKYEETLRYRLWSSLVWIERFTSIELGRPSMLPEDEILSPDGRSPQDIRSPLGSRDALEPLVQLSSIVSQVQKILRTSTAPTMALAAIDERLSILSTPYLQDLEAVITQPPGPENEWMILHVYSVQLHLHRHNFSPFSTPEVKQAALGCCAKVAGDTARLLLRIDEGYAQSHVADLASYDPTSRFLHIARLGPTSHLMLHLWRSTMYLVYSFDFLGAGICARHAASMGNLRPINSLCGKYLQFFLETLLHRIRHESPNFLHDEQLMTYLSADIHSNLDQSWVWTGFEPDHSPLAGNARSSNGADNSSNPSSPTKSSKVWDNWDGVLAMIRQLSERFPSSSSGEPPHHIDPRIPAAAGTGAAEDTERVPPQLPALVTSSSKASSRPNTSATSATTISPSSAGTSTNNRVSIADLMG